MSKTGLHPAAREGGAATPRVAAASDRHPPGSHRNLVGRSGPAAAARGPTGATTHANDNGPGGAPRQRGPAGFGAGRA